MVLISSLIRCCDSRCPVKPLAHPPLEQAVTREDTHKIVNVGQRFVFEIDFAQIGCDLCNDRDYRDYRDTDP